jgi:hypothetical protein
MRKLKLDADSLQVESFEPYAAGGRPAGTVRANEVTPGCTADCGVTFFEDTCAGCANTSPRPSCNDCSWDDVCHTFDINCD